MCSEMAMIVTNTTTMSTVRRIHRKKRLIIQSSENAQKIRHRKARFLDSRNS
jgi:hypothetical protein